uniref:Helicase/UvrB N-terminal domain-containing protein n=1 Tax=viral metagenome TaxID=1070528 RepID=A0A6C0AF54_9ZZZZ
MSVILKLNILKQEEIDIISKELTIYPYDKYEEEKKHQKKYTPYQTKAPVGISMFLPNPEDRTIRIPYTFACNLRPEFIQLNKKKDYLKIINDENFQVELLDKQIPFFNKARKQLSLHNTTSLCLPPGFGKTILGQALAFIKGLMSLTLVTRKKIGYAHVTTIQKCLPDLADKIWFVGKKGFRPPGKNYFNEIQTLPGEKKYEEDSYIPYFIICTSGSTHKIPKKVLEKVGTLIVDEAHLFCAPEKVECLLCTQPKFIILETATLQRGDKLERMVQLIAGEHRVYKRSDTQYIVYRLETNVCVQEEKGPRGVSYGKLCASLGEDEYRNGIFVNIIKSNPHRKFMILSLSVNHVKNLQKIFSKNEIESDILCGNKDNYSDSHVLIGTMSKMGVGFDEENACEDFKGVKSNVLFLAHSMAQWQLFEQYVGRVKRTSEIPIVIWMHDRNKMGRNHFKNLEDWIKLTNGEIIEIQYKPDGIILPELSKTEG